MNQKNDEALCHFQNLLKAKNWKGGVSLIAEKEFIHLNAISDLCDCLVFQSSLLRLDQKLEESNLLLLEIKKILEQNNISINFYWYFQVGLNYYVQGQYSSSLENFLKAKRLAGSKWEKIIVLTNITLCMENLGEPADNLSKALVKFLKGKDKSLLNEVQSQRKLIYRTRLFRDARFEKLLKEVSILGSSCDQNSFLNLWVSELPYQQYFKSLPHAFRESIFLRLEKLPRGSFRLNTITGEWQDSDRVKFIPMEMADRLYLWTWRWMADPKSTSLGYLLEICEEIVNRSGSVNYSYDDKLLIHQSVLWLNWLVPSKKQLFSRVLFIVQSPKILPTLFDWERQVFLCLSSDNIILPSKLKVEMNERGVHLGNLAWAVLGKESKLPIHLRDLAFRLRELRAASTKTASAKISVFLSSYLILREGKDPIASEPIALLISEIKNSKVVSFSNILEVGFGINKYVEDIHWSKVLNLIARVKKILPKEASLKTSHGRIYGTGDWSVVEVCRPFSLESPTVRNKSGVKELELQKQYFKPEIDLALLSRIPENSIFTRTDIERLTNKSKATAIRTLKSWKSHGWINALGSTRNRKYQKMTIKVTLSNLVH